MPIHVDSRSVLFAVLLTVLGSSLLRAGEPAGLSADLRRAVTFYASFDDKIAGDVGAGDLQLWIRYNSADPAEKGKTFAIPFADATSDIDCYRIRPEGGLSGGALDCRDLPKNAGRCFFQAKDHLRYDGKGWSGAVSLWINGNPNELLKTPFCDPIQITARNAADGAIWCDFPNTKPRDFRMGVFRGLKDGEKALKEDDPKASVMTIKEIPFKANEWHHVVLNWKNLDTGSPDAIAEIYVDGERRGRVSDRDLAMNWNIDEARVYIAVNYIGLFDELALFARDLTPGEIKSLHAQQGLQDLLKQNRLE